MSDKNMMNECYSCKNRGSVTGSVHSYCTKPDLDMKCSSQHALRWFFYPFDFDPTWKDRLCKNFEDINSKQSKECEHTFYYNICTKCAYKAKMGEQL